MYVVTQGAVLAGRVVFPQEGAALFSMTAIAVLIVGELFQGL